MIFIRISSVATSFKKLKHLSSVWYSLCMIGISRSWEWTSPKSQPSFISNLLTYIILYPIFWCLKPYSIPKKYQKIINQQVFFYPARHCCEDDSETHLQAKEDGFSMGPCFLSQLQDSKLQTNWGDLEEISWNTTRLYIRVRFYVSRFLVGYF